MSDYSNPITAYDAILIISFGGPEGMDEVMPFLENVLRGKNVPPVRMHEVAHHYELFDGISPINAQNRALIAALESELAASNIHLPIYWGNRNWHPLLVDTLQQMAADGIKNALAFITSAYSSYSGCRQYREDVMQAQAEVGASAPQISFTRKFYNHPGFIEPNIANVRASLDQIPQERLSATHLTFTAHSIPESMAQNSDYEKQLQEACQLVAQETGFEDHWALVYQSRSGSPRQPWLGPDIGDHLQELHRNGVKDVIVAPIGFISDHMEVLYDLDTEVQQLAQDLGINLIRAATVGVHPKFIIMIRQLISERMTTEPDRLYLGNRGPSHDVCPLDCCLSGIASTTALKTSDSVHQG